MDKLKAWFMLSMMVFLGQRPAAAQEDPASSIQEVAATHMETARNLINILVEFAVKYSFQVLGGIVVLVLGWIAANYVTRLILGFLEKKNIDVTVAKFMGAGIKIAIMSFAIIVALGKFGIEIAPLIAGISVAGFGLSFALQGPLSNFAAGATLIFTKPFKVGDIVEVAGVMGEVLDIKLPRTELQTLDGNKVVVPNNHIIGEIIHNYSDYKKLDVNVGVSYKADIDKALDIVRGVIHKEERISKEKEPKIGISEFADSSVNIYGRVWCKQADYWDIMFSVNKNIFDEFNKSGIEIPFPQRDVHIIGEESVLNR